MNARRSWSLAALLALPLLAFIARSPQGEAAKTRSKVLIYSGSGLGHTSESYSEPYIIELITGGLKYAFGR